MPNLFLQVLDQWYQTLPPTYTVGELVDKAVNWQKKGYLDRDVFNTLNEHVHQNICTTRYRFKYIPIQYLVAYFSVFISSYKFKHNRKESLQ